MQSKALECTGQCLPVGLGPTTLLSRNGGWECGEQLQGASVTAMATQQACSGLAIPGQRFSPSRDRQCGAHRHSTSWSSQPMLQRATLRGPEALAFQADSYAFPTTQQALSAHPSAPNHSFAAPRPTRSWALGALSLCRSFILVLLPTHPRFSPSSQENR